MISNLSQVISAALPQVRDAVPAAPSVPAGGAVAASAARGSGPAQGGANAVQSSSESQTLSDAVEKLNKSIQNLDRNLEFSLDQDSGDLVVKVVDAQTHTVIRQIPSEEALALAQNIDKYLQDHHTGLLQAKA
jgi:flagellar protein FlaG